MIRAYVNNKILAMQQAHIGALLNYRSVIDDGNTVLWLDASDEATITKDGSNLVSAWSDKLGSANAVTQATESKRPIHSVNKMEFDGVDDWVRSNSITLNQPTTVYMVVDVNTYAANKVIADGRTQFSGFVQMSGVGFFNDVFTPSAKLKINAGTSLLGDGIYTHINAGCKALLKYTFNSTTSKLKVGGNPRINGNAGTSNMGGISLGSDGVGANLSDIDVYEVIVRGVEDSEANDNVISKYLKNKYNLRTIVIIGDSTVSYYQNFTYPSVASLTALDYQTQDISTPGASISYEKTAFINNILSTDADAIIVQAGLNDLSKTESALISEYQDLIDTIRSHFGSSKKIIVSTMIPCDRAVGVNSARWEALNDAILGIGSTPITNVDGRIDTVSSALNAGDNSLDPAYQIVDDETHPNTDGRQIISNLWDAKLTELGLF